MSITLALEPHIIRAEDVTKIQSWMKERGGILVWRSCSLSNPGASWTTPRTDEFGIRVGKPSWESASEPERIITDLNEIAVVKDSEVRRFRVGVRVSGNGMMLKVTDGGSRRIRSAVAKAGDGAYNVFDYSTQEAVIMKPEGDPIPLTLWKGENE